MLKPVNDIRMTGKIGTALAAEGHEIHVIGYPVALPSPGEMTFHPLRPFHRISLRRLFMPWTVFRKVLRLRPDVLIITTHELLLAGIFLRMIQRRVRLIYDVQENYFRNVIYTGTFPSPLKYVMASYVRIKEWCAMPFIHHFLLAERTYSDELPLTGRPYTIIENKSLEISAKAPPIEPHDAIRFVFSGTLATSTGVFTAIRLMARMHKFEPKVHLTLAGYCADALVFEKIKKEIAGKDYITLVGGDRLVPHEEIVRCMTTSHAGIIAYTDNPATRNRIPTKLYEYLECRMPMVMVPNPVWEALCKPYAAAVLFDPQNPQADTVLAQLRTQHFYPVSPGSDHLWKSERHKLLHLIRKL